MTKQELVQFLKDNFTNEYGNVDISNLDFGDVNVNTSGMKTTKSIFQSHQQAGQNILQYKNKAGGSVYQNYNEAGRTIHQDSNKAGVDILQYYNKAKGKIIN